MKRQWPNSQYDCFYYSRKADRAEPCGVTVEEGAIELVFWSDETAYKYQGREVAPGRFELSGVDFDGRATLHGDLEAAVLEGSWTEEGISGMWKVTLGA